MKIEGDWHADFNGAKAALIFDDRLIVLRRDLREGIAFPGLVDLPGGGREAGETPLDCVRREIWEEIGLDIAPRRFHWARAFPRDGKPSWFLVADTSESEAARMRLENEGQACWTMPVAEFLSRDDAIPRLQARLRVYLEEAP